MKYRRSVLEEWASALGEAGYPILSLVHTEKAWLYRANAMDAFREAHRAPRDVTDYIELEIIHCLLLSSEAEVEAMERLALLRTKTDMSAENRIRTLLYAIDKKRLSHREDAIALLLEAKQEARDLGDLGIFINVTLALSELIAPPEALSQLEEALALARPLPTAHQQDVRLSRLLERVIELAYDLGLERVRLEALRQHQALEDLPF